MLHGISNAGILLTGVDLSHNKIGKFVVKVLIGIIDGDKGWDLRSLALESVDSDQKTCDDLIEGLERTASAGKLHSLNCLSVSYAGAMDRHITALDEKSRRIINIARGDG